MMTLAFLHGEGILFSFLIHSFLALLGGAVLLYGLVKYWSLSGAVVAGGYVATTFTVTLLSHSFSIQPLVSTAWVLTLPWNQVVPCFNLDSSCPLTPGVSFICAELNAVAIYFLVRRLTRGE
jgi:hypothetical protein